MANLMEKSYTRQRPFRFVPFMLQGVWFLIQMMFHHQTHDSLVINVVRFVLDNAIHSFDEI